MASLPHQMLLSLVDVCLAARIDRESLLAAVPSDIVACIPGGDTPQKQLFHAWCHLNKMPWPTDRPHPMNLALETGGYLTRAYGMADIFSVATLHFAEPATIDNSKDRAFYALFTRRMKETYLDFGCRVTPSVEDPPGPFMVEHPDRRTSVVAVFYNGGDTGPHLRAVISDVERWLRSARRGGEEAEGYVVLAPSARKADREQVLEAQLYPIDYGERRSIGLDAMERVVRCMLGVETASERTGFSIVQGGEARPAGDALAAFLRDFRTRVWLLLRPRDADANAFQKDLFHLAARGFLQQGLPAPVPLDGSWRTRRVSECASELFTRHGIPASSIVMDRVLREGAICPILTHDDAAPLPPAVNPPMIPRLVEGLSERSKLLVLFAPESVAAARRLESALLGEGHEARVVRALMDE